MDKELYEKNSDMYLIARHKYRQLKKQGKLSKRQIKEIEKRFRVMSYWLLLNTPNHKEKIILQHRLFLCLKNWEINR
ncbi:MAG TPA: hypothetical protein VJ438_06475 [Candidatus Nanoarchaeia archaeon]|nr:hypothetical protein [Candidatus Nanoarchaeia archaeon]